MPHYSDGTEAKVGDLVFGKTHGGADPVAGHVLSIIPGSDTCNMHVAVLRPVDSGSYWGALLNIGPGGGDRQNFAANVDLANCKDMSLLHRKPEPPDTQAT